MPVIRNVMYDSLSAVLCGSVLGVRLQVSLHIHMCRTLQTHEITRRAQEAGINDNTVSEVLKVGQFNNTGPVDPAKFCVLLITTITLDVPGLLGAMVQVFGNGTSIDAKLCKQVLTALGQYDDRWQHGDIMHQLEAAAVAGEVTESALLNIPAVKNMVQTAA
jgi:hypothetical protein